MVVFLDAFVLLRDDLNFSNELFASHPKKTIINHIKNKYIKVVVNQEWVTRSLQIIY